MLAGVESGPGTEAAGGSPDAIHALPPSPWFSSKDEARNAGPTKAALTIAVLVMIAGSLLVAPAWSHLRVLWASDSLRSIGAWFPLLSLLGVLRAWRGLGWTLRGSAWGLVPIALSAPLAQFLVVRDLRLVLLGHEFGLAELGVAVFVYAAGALLLFGGPRLLRASLASLCLLLLLNPVPHLYNLLVDMPLQELSANTARAFAHLIGLHPTGEQLQMMFAPNFGMMIVPGCNGVRGSVTLAYLALIFGHWLRLRPRRLVMVTALGFAAGFALNLLRLCVLVLYYRVGIAIPSIQRHGSAVDYAIGGSLFLLATLAFGLLLRWFAAEEGSKPIPPAPMHLASASEMRGTLLRGCCLLALAAVAYATQARALITESAAPTTMAEAAKLLPAHVGLFSLQRTYGEQQSGSLMMVLGDYTAPPAATTPERHVTLGFYLPAAYHLVVVSKQLQGVYPLWTGSLKAQARGSMPATLAASFYDDGVARQENAEAICSLQRCFADVPAGNSIAVEMNVGSAADLALGAGKRIPVLLRREWPDNDPRPSEELRAAFAEDARAFLAGVDLRPVVQSAGHRP